MESTSKYFLASILECSVRDLGALDRINYESDEIDDIVTQAACADYMTLGKILEITYSKGVFEIETEVKALINYFKEHPKMDISKRISTLMDLLKLDPQEDFEYNYHNGDIEVNVNRYGDLYQKYLGYALEKFQDDTGFKLMF